MSAPFERRVEGATMAGWWTLLAASLLVTLQWILYLIIMSTRPAWIMALLGPDTGWNVVQRLSTATWACTRSSSTTPSWTST